MSICRFSDDSDVYVYRSIEGGIECGGCRLGAKFNAPNAEAMLAHLQKHIAVGHRVPADALQELAETA
jgi:hypothetical protein